MDWIKVNDKLHESDNDKQIKPCPFCGKKVEIKQKGTHGYDLTSYISCCAIMYGDYENEDGLIERWNTRRNNNDKISTNNKHEH